ncbi:MAG: hypothetical protein FWD76_02485 [Firmicutes bacterium]|nr:hypothetical protein [Bacillota bacterium]
MDNKGAWGRAFFVGTVFDLGYQGIKVSRYQGIKVSRYQGIKGVLRAICIFFASQK